MNCGQFRQFYSDFTDGLLDETDEVAFHVHMGECVACRRFDAALEQGRSALRRMDPPMAGVDFESRLFDRILRLDEIHPQPVLRQWSGMAGAVLIVAVVGVVGLNVRTAMRPQAAPFRPVSAMGTAGTSPTDVFIPRLTGDTTIRYVGRIPMIPVSTDTSQASARAGRAVEIGTDYMVP